jgi:hypothetical protein
MHGCIKLIINCHVIVLIKIVYRLILYSGEHKVYNIFAPTKNLLVLVTEPALKLRHYKSYEICLT